MGKIEKRGEGSSGGGALAGALASAPMSQDIEYFRGKYADSLDEVETLVAPLRRGEVPPDDVSARLTDVDAAIKTATGVKKSYSLELRLLRDRAVRAEYETALAKLNAKCEQLEADAQTARAAHAAAQDRAELLGGSGAPTEDGVRQAGKTNDQYLAAANAVQDQTDQSVEKTLAMIEASKDVGNATLEELARQREQIASVGDEVSKIEDNLTRADRLIRTFGKRMATDKCIQVFTIINLIMVVVIVVYAILTKRISLDGGGDGGKGDTPDVTSADDATDSTDSVDSSSRRFLRGWRS